ncbi:MAG TPA: UDP-N-acetylmuramate dehydrogenase [Stellaceae bacterium]
MMAAAMPTHHLINRLPKVRGRLSADAPLAQVTWFRVGGPAEVMFRPADIDDLSAFLAAKPADVPVTVIGVASNLLVRDGGIKGVVVRLGRGFVEIEAKDATVTAGAGALDFNVALSARDAGITGLEFLSGIPGTVGGGLRMNAGAYGSELKDALQSATALDAQGGRHELPVAALDLSYRHSGVPDDWIFVAARFAGTAGDRLAIARRMAEIQAAREASQPIRAKTGGSTFANPPGHKAWQLIDEAGCRGIRRGSAMISDKHANFLINTGEATAADIEALGEEVRARVLAKTGITLDWEIRRIGVAAGGAA